MGYSEGAAIAEDFVSRHDWFGKKKAKCDPRYGWKKGTGGKCVRVSPEKDPEKSFGTDVFLTEGDKDTMNSFGSNYIDQYQDEGGLPREKAVKLLRDEMRVGAQGDGDSLGEEEEDLFAFYSDPKSRNKFGTSTYVSKAEESFIEEMGLGNVKGLSKDKEINYLRDVFMASPKYSRNSQRDLDLVNKHYFGNK